MRDYNDKTIEADHSGLVLRVRVLRLSINYSVFVNELPSRLVMLAARTDPHWTKITTLAFLFALIAVVVVWSS